MENEKWDREIDEVNDRLPLGYTPTEYVVVMVAPRIWDVVEVFEANGDGRRKATPKEIKMKTITDFDSKLLCGGMDKGTRGDTK